MLPFCAPAPFAGQVEDPSGKVVVREYAGRLGILNPSDQPTGVTLLLPAGARQCRDLSSGIPQAVGQPGADGRLRVSLNLGPWSLRVLEPEPHG